MIHQYIVHIQSHGHFSIVLPRHLVVLFNGHPKPEVCCTDIGVRNYVRI